MVAIRWKFGPRRWLVDRGSLEGYNKRMKSPFPGMDPYLEHPALWQEVHNRLVASLADELAPILAPRYFVGTERRVYLLERAELVLVGVPDVLITPRESTLQPAGYPFAAAGIVEVEIPIGAREFRSAYLEIREVQTRLVVTVVELLSPANKIGGGREACLNKRLNIMKSLTSLVEIDLIRAGERMPFTGEIAPGDYRILVSRAWERPKALLLPFRLRDPIPDFPLPLVHGEEPVTVELNRIFHALYARARYDLQLDYSQPAVPPLSGEDAAWAEELVVKAG